MKRILRSHVVAEENAAKSPAGTSHHYSNHSAYFACSEFSFGKPGAFVLASRNSGFAHLCVK